MSLKQILELPKGRLIAMGIEVSFSQEELSRCYYHCLEKELDFYGMETQADICVLAMRNGYGEIPKVYSLKD